MARHADPDDGRVILAFWAAIDILRPLLLVYTAAQFSMRMEEVVHPARGWTILGCLAVWTALGLVVRRRTRWWLTLESLVGVVAILASGLVDSREVIAAGAPTVPGMWPSATVLSWGVLTGPVGGTLAALAVAAADLILIRTPSDLTMHNIVILLMLGCLVGYCASLAREGQRAAREAAAVQAQARERERLARSVHDGVLQALSLVHRRGLELGGEAADLGRLAAEQERNLRELIKVPSAADVDGRRAGGDVDLATLLGARAGARVTVVETGEEMLLPAPRAEEVDAAVGAVLDNVAAHAGDDAQAWILLERIGEEVVVTVRDNGCGTTPERLRQAQADGRMGVSCSIMGRMADIGGSAEITSSPAGTRVELRAPVATEGTGR